MNFARFPRQQKSTLWRTCHKAENGIVVEIRLYRFYIKIQLNLEKFSPNELSFLQRNVL